MPEVTLQSETVRAETAARVFVTDQKTESTIRESLAALGVENVQVTSGGVAAAIASMVKESSPHLLVVDVSGIADPLGRLRYLAEFCDPDVLVIVIGDRNDVEFYREIKSIGASEYFLKPLIKSQFTALCQPILAPDARLASHNSGKLVYVLGARGGAGATTIAVNLAWCLAEGKRRRTILVDLNLRDGDAALQLDTENNQALSEALQDPERVDRLFLERGVRHVTGRLDLLCSLAPVDFSYSISGEAIQGLMDKLLGRYRLTIVEAGPSTSAQLTEALRLPSTCLLVSNPTLAGAREVARWSECLGPDTPQRDTVLILNRTAAYGGLSLQDFIRASGKTPNLVIPHDRELAEAAPLGINATQKCKTFQRCLLRIVRGLTGEETQEERTILSRIFG